MKRMRLLMLGVCLMTCIAAQAQWRVGLTVGYSSNHYDIDTQYAYDWRYSDKGGFVVGIPVQYDFNYWFALRAEPTFIQKGFKRERTHTYSGVYTDERDNYLQLPLLARFSFGGTRLRGFVSVGGYMGYWIYSHWKGYDIPVDYELYEGYVYTAPFDERRQFNSTRDNRFEAGLAGGLGISYALTPRIAVEAEWRLYYGLTSTRKDYMRTRYPQYNTTMAFQAGVSYSF